MRGLAELTARPEGRRWLEDHGVYTTLAAFRECLRLPSHPQLGARIGARSDQPLVYVGHQLLADYRNSVTAKLSAAKELADTGQVTAAMLWLDTDRAGSDRGSMGLTWPLHHRPAARLAPRRLRHCETRFLPVRAQDLSAAIDDVAVWVANDLRGPVRERAMHRVRRLAAALSDPTISTLAQANQVISTRLITEHVGVPLPSVLGSDVVQLPIVQEQLEGLLNAIDDVVGVVNRTIQQLRDANVDPHLRPFRENYLPLRYSCPDSGERVMLHLERRGMDRFAVATCTRGCEHRFHLGSHRLTIDEVAATHRWSTDVTLPVYVNAVVSGVIAGRSSGLYGIVLNAVVEQVLHSRPVPIFAAIAPPNSPGRPDSLLYEFLTAP